MTAIEQPVASRLSLELRLLVGVQMFFWFGYFVGVGGMLLIAALQSDGLTFVPFYEPVDRATPVHAADPKEVLGLGIVGYLLHLPLAFIAILGTWVGALAAAAGLIALVPLWIAGARPWLLTISTALTIAYVAVQLSPVGELVKVWMLD
ncbi:MAG TPA: hypothetical protein DGG94_04240 [Micromonosporaceae bacterium]|nr:hypothetical protein [Micromonosporaceae bacterium]HCU49009.1 hypothetical protein [Micromonosporaceae bacterium]